MNIVQIPTNNQAPVIAGVEITKDSEGRYNLNALHKAHLELNPSIHRNSKQPADWLKLEGTKELIEEIFNSEDLHIKPVEAKAGRYGGTFAHELLAVSYAGWVSSAFQLKVNQIFIDFRSGKLNKPTELSRMDLIKLALEAEQDRLRLESVTHEQAQEIQDLKSLFKQGVTIPNFCKMLNGVNIMQVNAVFQELGWVYKDNSRGWRVASYARDRYLTEKENEISPHGRDSFVTFNPILLRSGAQRVYELYRQGKLPMKKTWDGNFSHWKLEHEVVKGGYAYASSRLQ